MKRHPLAEALHKLHKTKFATEDELVAYLEWAQLETEKLWASGEVEKLIVGAAGTTRTCGRQGCNYSRYPASDYCMYHASGHDALVARLRRK